MSSQMVVVGGTNRGMQFSNEDLSSQFRMMPLKALELCTVCRFVGDINYRMIAKYSHPLTFTHVLSSLEIEQFYICFLYAI